MAYPPAPWHLGGELLLSVFASPAARLPGELAAALPAGRRPLRLAGRALVGVALVDYAPGGVLAYRELLVAVACVPRRGPEVTIAQIWVDSPASLAGGRALWGIPKRLAEFERGAVRIDGAEAATLTATVGGALLPGRRRLSLVTAQRLDGTDRITRSLILARVRHLSAEWTFAPAGPLGHLAGRRPLTSLALTDAAIHFGLP